MASIMVVFACPIRNCHIGRTFAPILCPVLIKGVISTVILLIQEPVSMGGKPIGSSAMVLSIVTVISIACILLLWR